MSCVRLFPSVRKELGGLGSLLCNRHLSAGQCSSISTGNAGIFLKGVNTVLSGKQNQATNQKTEKALLRERTNRMHNPVTMLLNNVISFCFSCFWMFRPDYCNQYSVHPHLKLDTQVQDSNLKFFPYCKIQP